MSKCPNCGKENRSGARFCQFCGKELAQDIPTPTKDVVSSIFDSVLGSLRGLWDSLTEQAGAPTPPPPQRTRILEVSSGPVEEPGKPLAVGSILRHPDNGRRYAILIARPLRFSIYYDGLDLTCPHCQQVYDQPPALGVCPRCQSPLLTVLIHEQRNPVQSLSTEEVEHLLTVSAGYTNILPHRDILQYREHVYTVTAHPGQWGVLVRRRQPRSIDEAIAGAVQVGEALSYLHHCGFSHCQKTALSAEGLIVVSGGSDIYLADLSSCMPIPADNPQAARAQVSRDIRFLGALLLCLATGQWDKRLGQAIESAPAELRVFIQRAVQGEYATVQDMITDFRLMPSMPLSVRPLRPVYGHAVHPGQRHPRNEDATAIFTFSREQDGRTVPIGLFLVADGMGGHEAGDIASRTVSETVSNWLLDARVLPDLRRATRKLSTDQTPAEMLAQAVQEANEKLWQRAQARGSDQGSTVAAVLIIGDVATIASVGDSRVYLLREGQMQQLTQDHSLVARLVDAGVIQPDEVRSHPQRNQIYRCLGHKAQVEVDTFTRELRKGDRLIICSDGLWEMVLDADIQRIVEQARSPQQACDALVEAANLAGGDDNISVIVVVME